MRRVLLSLLCAVAAGAMAHSGGVDGDGCHLEQKANRIHCHPGRAKPAARLAQSQRPPRAGEEGVFDGPVVWVGDGDTLRVRVRDIDMDVRLADIDAPESDQPYGWSAKLELIDLVRDRHVVLVPRDTDRYGRTVAYLWVGDVNVNRELMRRGAAWFYSRYAEDEALFYIEEEARTAKRGLWALPMPERIEPWEWRRRREEK